jgi:hypothetical protein
MKDDYAGDFQSLENIPEGPLVDGASQAFPYQFKDEPFLAMEPGLTKREYFAAIAMQGLLAAANPEVFMGTISLAAEAVERADALIAELNK